MATQLKPKEEFMVLMAIKDKGEATLPEIQTYISEHWQVQIDIDTINRYCRRWKKRKVFSANLFADDWMYSLRDIPWYPEAQMIHVVKPDVSDLEAKVFLQNYQDEIKTRGSVSKRMPDIRGYKTLQIVFETLDYVAGGLPSEEEGILVFPRHNGSDTPYIPRNWIKAYHRWNSRLIDVNENFARDRFAFSAGIFEETPKLSKQTKIGKAGPITYEVIPPHTRFAFTLRYPTHGCDVNLDEMIPELYKMCEDAPLRGFGAYDSAFGGRVKVVSLKQT